MKKLFILVIAVLLFSMNASAEMITFRATGNITHIGSGLDTDILLGDSFTLDLTFDSALPDLNGSSLRGRYLGEHMSLETGTFQADTFAGPSFAPDINISNNFFVNIDQYGWNSGLEPHQAPLQGDRELVSIVTQFQDNQGTIFDSDALPLIPPDINEFEVSKLELLFSNDYTPGIAAFDAKWIYGDITQLSVVPAVPEPTTLALLGIGLIGLAGAEVRRRRKKKAVDKS